MSEMIPTSETDIIPESTNSSQFALGIFETSEVQDICPFCRNSIYQGGCTDEFVWAFTLDL